MKHVHCLTRTPVRPAQSDFTELIGLIATIMSTLGGILLTVLPLLEKSR